MRRAFAAFAQLYLTYKLRRCEMTKTNLKRTTLGLAIATGVVFALGACSDGYSRGYSRSSVGVTYRDGGPGYRDRDHDGIPNRYDRDRDGDGVPNRFDDRPNNPYRN
jgi:hypothetical protein